jgi:hypothetical protein
MGISSDARLTSAEMFGRFLRHASRAMSLSARVALPAVAGAGAGGRGGEGSDGSVGVGVAVGVGMAVAVGMAVGVGVGDPRSGTGIRACPIAKTIPAVANTMIKPVRGWPRHLLRVAVTARDPSTMPRSGA